VLDVIASEPVTWWVDEAAHVMHVAGDLEHDAGLAGAVSHLDEHPGIRYLDLSQVTYLPARAVATIVGSLLRLAEQGRTVRLAAAPDTISRRVLTAVWVPAVSLPVP